MKPFLAAALLGLAAISPAAVQAQQVATTGKQVNLRAGPDRVYPVVAVLPPGVQVIVQGCLADYRWCDVAWGPERGWAYAGNLRYPYQHSYAPLPSVAPIAGVVILSFVLDDYWHDHYRDRSWYPDRHRWVRPPPPPPPPRVRPRPPPPRDDHPPRDGRPPRTDRPHPPAPRVGTPPPQPRPGMPPPQVRPRPPSPPPSNSGWDPRWPNAPRPDQP